MFLGNWLWNVFLMTRFKLVRVIGGQKLKKFGSDFLGQKSEQRKIPSFPLAFDGECKDDFCQLLARHLSTFLVPKLMNCNAENGWKAVKKMDFRSQNFEVLIIPDSWREENRILSQRSCWIEHLKPFRRPPVSYYDVIFDKNV